MRILKNKTVPALRELAKLYKIQGYSGMKKQMLVQALALQMSDDKIMSEIFSLLKDHERVLFKRLIEDENYFPDEFIAENYATLFKFGMIELCSDKFIVSDEIKEVYRRLKERSILIYDYIKATTHLYGVISQDDFVKLFNSQNERKTSIAEIIPILLEYECAFWDEYLINDDFVKNGYKDIEKYVKSANRHTKYIPQKEQLLKYADRDYFEETHHTRKVQDFIKDLSGNSDAADKIMKEINYISFADIKFQAIFDILDKYQIEFDSRFQMERFVSVLTDMYNSSRKWLNNGHTPKEISGINSTKYTGRDETFTYTLRKSSQDTHPKVGRNEPCPCGSGKKYKKCCIRKNLI